VGPEGIVLKNHSNVPLIRRDRGYGLPVEIDLPVIRFVKSSNKAKDSCLPTARRAEKGEKFSVMDLQRNMTHRFQYAETLHDVLKLNIHSKLSSGRQ
jgi:hypothetical protein